MQAVEPEWHKILVEDLSADKKKRNRKTELSLSKAIIEKSIILQNFDLLIHSKTMKETTLTQDIDQLLQSTLENTFGFQTFRTGQKEAIKTLLSKCKVLCILPTGHGKSLLYQLPACLLGGMTLVISPLLALVRDQIFHLNHRFKIPAVGINSDQTDKENEAARQAAALGMVHILFVAPEQLDHVDRFQFLLNLDVRLIVVDEAHCISTWGHDFRPSYRQILNFISELHKRNRHIKILGLTATANQRVENDIKQQLSLSGEIQEYFIQAT